ncbi:outer membrane lipoprotein carrier protein LolA [Shewanella donghaensis]|uniref:outer membrane lipoprotein carrier protein LolA n=1 Tax=Shewanella donghaensis TaxID=238836 RepID=UPI001184680B|nr:outer membrane lipoprotein carrier protein LolA [Shewanella donghaensis]
MKSFIYAVFLVPFLLISLAANTSASELTTVKNTSELVSDDIAAIFKQHATPDQLSQLASQLQLSPQTKGQFIQTRYLAVLKKPLKSQGVFIFSQQQGLFWQQTKPFPTTLVLKDRMLIQQDSFGNIQQSNANQASAAMAEQLPMLMQALLTGDVKALEKDFQLYMPAVINTAENTSAGHATLWQLGLVAKDPMIQKAIGALILEGSLAPTQADKSVTQIERLTMLSSVEAAINNQKTDKTLIEFSHIENQLTEADIKRFDLMPSASSDEH